MHKHKHLYNMYMHMYMCMHRRQRWPWRRPAPLRASPIPHWQRLGSYRDERVDMRASRCIAATCSPNLVEPIPRPAVAAVEEEEEEQAAVAAAVAAAEQQE